MILLPSMIGSCSDCMLDIIRKIISNLDYVYSALVSAVFFQRGRARLYIIKGTMSEAELFVLRARLQGGIRNYARRGALKLHLPTGLCYTPRRSRTICRNVSTRRSSRLNFGAGLPQLLEALHLLFLQILWSAKEEPGGF